MKVNGGLLLLHSSDEDCWLTTLARNAYEQQKQEAAPASCKWV